MPERTVIARRAGAPGPQLQHLVEPSDWIEVTEAATTLSISTRAVYELVARGILRCRVIGEGMRVLRTDAEAYREVASRPRWASRAPGAS